MNRLRATSFYTIVALAGATLVCAAVGSALQQQDTAPVLPKPVVTGGMTLNEALATRRSVRSYEDTPLKPDQISQILWAAQGITEPQKGLRTAPSAMTLFSIHVFVVCRKGVHEYLPAEHRLKTLSTENIVAQLRAIPPNPPDLGGAPFVLVLAMDLAPLEARVGPRAERYAFMEAGHVAQNVLLQATAVGLGSIPVGGFDEAKVKELLKLPDNLRPIYLLPIGTPKR